MYRINSFIKVSCSSANLIATQFFHLANEYKLLPDHFDSSIRSNPPSLERRFWKPHDPRYLKVNIDIAFFKYKIGTGILVRNHLRISVLAKALPCQGRFTMNYREFISIISSISDHLIIENDSLWPSKVSPLQEGDLSELSSLSSHFLNFIDPGSTSFYHVCRSGNCLAHLLTKYPVLSKVTIEWTQNILSDVAHIIQLDINKI